MSVPPARPPRTIPIEDDPQRESGPRNLLTPISLFLVLVLFWLVVNLSSVVVSALMAVLLGTILEGPVRRLQNRGFPRAAAIAACYVVMIGAIVLLGALIVPVVKDQASQFRDEIPAKLEELHGEWDKSSIGLINGPGADLLQQAIDTIERPSGTVQVTGDTAASALPFVTTVGGAIAAIVTTLVVTFYYVLEKKLLRQVVLEQLSPRVTSRVDYLWTEVENKVGGWLRGQLTLCLIIGLCATLGYGLLGLNFWPLLGLWAGITEIIPIVGPWIGGIPAVLIALTTGTREALITMLIIFGIQTLENWFLVPRVMKGAVGLTPLTVFVAILAGTELQGPIGAVLAIPLAAGAQVILTDMFAERRARFATPSSQFSGWRWMLGRAQGREMPGPVANDEPQQIVSAETFHSTHHRSPHEDAPDVEDQPHRSVPDDHLNDETTATWPTNPWKSASRTTPIPNGWRGMRTPSDGAHRSPRRDGRD